MNKRFSLKKRSFLTNARHADSYIRYNINYQPRYTGKHWRTGKPVENPASFSAWLKMTDCHNMIDWDFSGMDAQKKLDTTRKIMNSFFDGVQKCIDFKNKANKKGKNGKRKTTT